MTPHAKLKQNWQLLISTLIAAVILVASCRKERHLPGEPTPADHSIREWIKKHTLPDTVKNNTN